VSGSGVWTFLSPPKRGANRGLLEEASVARERWIGGWEAEAAALARRLLVLNSGWCQAVSDSSMDAELEHGRGGASWAHKATGQRAGCLLTLQ